MTDFLTGLSVAIKQIFKSKKTINAKNINKSPMVPNKKAPTNSLNIPESKKNLAIKVMINNTLKKEIM